MCTFVFFLNIFPKDTKMLLSAGSLLAMMAATMSARQERVVSDDRIEKMTKWVKDQKVIN